VGFSGKAVRGRIHVPACDGEMGIGHRGTGGDHPAIVRPGVPEIPEVHPFADGFGAGVHLPFLVFIFDVLRRTDGADRREEETGIRREIHYTGRFGHYRRGKSDGDFDRLAGGEGDNINM